MKLLDTIKKAVFGVVFLSALLLLAFLLLAAIGYFLFPEELNTSNLNNPQTTQSVSLVDYLPGGKEIMLEEAYRMFPERVVYLAEVGLTINNGSKLYVKDGRLYVAKITDSDAYYWFIGGEGWHYHLECFNDSSRLLPYVVSGESVTEKRWWTKLIEKVGEDTYRVTVVHFDDLFTKKYLIVDFNASLKDSGYRIKNNIEYPDPGYYQTIYKPNGKWSAASYSGPLELLVYRDPNREDNRIIEEVARQIEKFANENGLNNTQKVILTAKIVQKMLVYESSDRVYIYESGEFKPTNVKVKDSRMKQDLLEGTVCRGFAEWTSSILNEMGIRACHYWFEHSRFKDFAHGEVAVDVNDVDTNYIRNIANKNIAVINATVGKFNMSFIVIEPQEADCGDLGFESLNEVVDPKYPKKYLMFHLHGSRAVQLYWDEFKGI